MVAGKRAQISSKSGFIPQGSRLLFGTSLGRRPGASAAQYIEAPMTAPALQLDLPLTVALSAGGEHDPVGPAARGVRDLQVAATQAVAFEGRARRELSARARLRVLPAPG